MQYGTLVGAALDMASVVRNCIRLLDVPLVQALRFASYTARVLGLDRSLGRIAPGYRADMVAFNPDDIRIHETWGAGEAATTESVRP
jgi:N-acetylglucosamine-6-phosphate deacetylase